MKRTVALIYGGEGFEHDISCIGAENINGMIDRSQYDVMRIFISKSGEWFIEDEEEKIPTFPVFINGNSGFIANGKIKTADVAIPLLHGDRGEDGAIMGALSTAHIKLVGCGVLAGAVCADKVCTKIIADALNIPTAKWIFSTDETYDSVIENAESALGYPMFIKPSALGSSIGISRVSCREEFKTAYKKARALSERVLIEEAVNVRRELECAYLGASGKSCFKIGEVMSGGNFYDFDKKYRFPTKTKTEVTGKDVESSVTALTKKLKHAIGIKQMSRFDFFLTEDGKILFNEINTFPGMTKTSLYPLLTLKMGFSEGEFINSLIAEALI